MLIASKSRIVTPNARKCQIIAFASVENKQSAVKIGEATMFIGSNTWNSLHV